MSLIRRFQDDWLASEELAESEIRILLADHDPISRYVLGTVLSKADRVDVVASVDSHGPSSEWALSGVDVVVLTIGPLEDLFDTVEGLVAKGIKVLMLGTGWTRERVTSAIDAGASGCLVKDAQVGALAADVRAVAAGHMVFSPELLRHQLAMPDPSAELPVPVQVRGTPSVGRLVDSLTERELEVLALLSGGSSTVEVATSLRVSPATVKSHVSHALTKLGVRNRLEAVLLIQRFLPSGRRVSVPV